MKLSEIRKAAVAVAGAVGQVVALGVLHGTVLHWAQVVLSVATAAGVYGVRNARPIPGVPPAGFLSPGASPTCGNGCSCVKAPTR